MEGLPNCRAPLRSTIYFRQNAGMSLGSILMPNEKPGQLDRVLLFLQLFCCIFIRLTLQLDCLLKSVLKRLQGQSNAQLNGLVSPAILVIDVVQILESNHIPTIHPKHCEFELYTTHHGEVAGTKSFPSILQ